jgi:hypothetical protein
MSKVTVSFDSSDAEFLIRILDEAALDYTDSMYYDYEDQGEFVGKIDALISLIKEQIPTRN